MAGRMESDELTECHEINVTPFIDVMLVLLIIFMVAAPLSTVDVPVDLPSASAPPTKRPEDPLFVSVKADTSVLLGNSPVELAGLAAALDEKTGGAKETRVFLRADKVVDYGTLMTVMNRLRDSGYLKVALVGLEEVK
ncbi:MAG: TonB system transport protein ExbD [Rhodospirillaceae bacterium]|nr:TonB system transport protein ExbD [Rhodospirillaceae bacterium]